MRYCILLLLPILFLFSSCEDDKEIEKMVTNYFPLEVGNHWVYDTYQFDYIQNSYSFLRQDSVFVSRDTSVNGVRYFRYCGFISSNQSSCSWWTYSDGELKSIGGATLLATDRPGEILSSYPVTSSPTDTMATVDNKMLGMATVNVPAGNFVTFERNEIVNYNPDLLPDNKPNPYTSQLHYAEDIGPVLYQFTFFSQSGFTERRLVRYQVN